MAHFMFTCKNRVVLENFWWRNQTLGLLIWLETFFWSFEQCPQLSWVNVQLLSPNTGSFGALSGGMMRRYSAKRVRYCSGKSALKRLLFLVPIFGSRKTRQWHNLDGFTSETLGPSGTLISYWKPRVLFVTWKMIWHVFWYYFASVVKNKRKNILPNFHCDPWLGSPYSWRFLPHSHSAVVLLFP